jgi:hypothetical protein
MDGLLSEEQCKTLFELASNGVVGDGYEGDKKPHSKGEEFAGISLLTAARLADIGAVDAAAVQLYHDINFKLANVVKEYFKLEEELYIGEKRPLYTFLTSFRLHPSCLPRT